MGGRLRWLAGLLTACVFADLAVAGVITYNTDEVEEVGHSVSAQLDGQQVRLTVHREIANRGTRADEALLELELPAGAAVIGMRARESGDWRRGQLLEADNAEKRYQEPGERRGSAGTGPVLLGWGFLGLAYAKMYPLAGGQSREIEYQLLAAPCYVDGAYAIAYPATGEQTPRFDLDGGRGHAWVVDPQRPADARWADIEERCARANYIPFQDKVVWLVFEPPGREPVRAAYGRFAVSGERALARVEIDVARVLEPAPHRAQVVFAIDASRSMGEAGIAAQLELTRAYLRKLPDAEFELVLYRRFPRRLFGKFQPAKRADDVIAAIAPADLEPGNGSHLDRGLALAGSLLAGRRGPTRVVAFTDGLVRRRLGAADTAATVPQKLGAVVHLVQFERVDGERYWSQRRDADRLAPIASAHGGMLVAVRGQVGSAGADDVMAGLVRPLQIDNFTIEVGGDPIYLAGDRGNVLAEGEGARFFAVLPGAPAEVVVRGNVWGREFSRKLSPEPRFSATLPALVFGDPIWAELDSAELTRAATSGGAVSAATSFLTGADAAVDLHAGSMGMGGGRVSPGQRFCCLYHAPPRVSQERVVDRGAVLSAQLQPGVAACANAHGQRTYKIKATIETTRGEVVDVALVDGLDEGFHDCVEEQMWGLSLDGVEFNEPLRQFDVNLASGE